MKRFLLLPVLFFVSQSNAQFSEDVVETGEPYQIQPRFEVNERTRALNYKKAGITDEAFDYLKQCHTVFSKYTGERNKKIQNVILADFSECMEQPRLFVIKYDTEKPERSTVELRTWVSHGSGSGRKNPREREWACTTAKQLSDGKATQQTPAGCMRIFGAGLKGFMPSFPDLRGFYVSGLEEMNECSYTKGIRLHNYPEFTNPTATKQVTVGSDTHRANSVSNSAGCMRVDNREIDVLKKYINSKEGTLLVNYPGRNSHDPPRTIVPRPNLDKYTSAMEFEAKGNRKRKCVEQERAPVVRVIPNENTVMRRWFTGTTVTPATGNNSAQ